MPEQNYEYSAFISYRHKPLDRKWAKWLLNAIETYRVPKELQKKGFPARLSKLFRDEEEIPASADLSDEIRQALQRSRFLIVVCSKNTPVSKWVSEEIRTFHALGRSNQILALLVDGEPDEAFPNILLKIPHTIFDNGDIVWKDQQREPIASDVRSREDTSDKEIKYTALLRMVSALLGVKFDDLKQRDLERKRKKRRQNILASFILFFLTVTGAFYWWDQTRIKTSYYANFSTRWGVPFGIHKLDKSTASRRQKNYLFQERGGKVIAMKIINGSGGLLKNDKDKSRASQWLLSYTDGNLEKIRLLNRNNHLIRFEKYEFDITKKEAVVSFKLGVGRAFTQSAQLSLLGMRQSKKTKQRTQITQNRLYFDQRGFIIKRGYENIYGIHLSDSTNSYGKLYKRNDKGQILTERSFGKGGQSIVLKNGISFIRNTFSVTSDLITTSWHNKNSKLIPNDRGYAKAIYTTDNMGNFIEKSFLDINENPVLSVDGYARRTSQYDAQGNKIQSAYFGIDGKPVSLNPY